MTDAIYLDPQRVQLVDPATGKVTRAGGLFLMSLFQRIGGSVSLTPAELSDLVDQLQASETLMQPPPAGEGAPADIAQPQPPPADLLPDIVQPTPAGGAGTQGAMGAIAVGASPYTYTAAYPQAVSVRGGTVTTISYGRGGALTLLGTIAGLFELQTGDSLRVAYTAAPTMNYIPR